VTDHRGAVTGARRRRIAAVLFGALAAAVTSVAVVAAVADGVTRPLVSAVLVVALIGANLAPVVAVTGGRIDAFTPVGALLVPIGLLLPLPEAIVVYALGEATGVLAAHRWDRHVGGPADDGGTRTTFVVGKSIVGAVVGLVALQATAALGAGLAVQVAAAFVGVAVSTVVDRLTVVTVAVLVRQGSFGVELRRGLGELALVALGEVVAGALIAVLATRDPWSLLLGLAVLGLLMVAGTAYARAAADREDTRELLRLAEELQQALTIADVTDTLLASARRLLPEDEVTVADRRPDGDHRSWRLPGIPDRWLTTPRIVDTRDYETQPMVMVEAAVSLSRVALTRAAAQEQLAEQDRLRSLVLSTVAHDLRGPLAVAGGSLETLAGSDARVDERQRGELIEACRRAVNRMRRLVDDLLGLELAEERRATTTGHTDVGEVLCALVADLSLGDTRIAVEVGEAEAAIDPVSLERIVENLVSNAAKYSPAQGTVHVRYGRADGGGTVIVVADEGPGVAVDDRARIFEPFQQAGERRDGVGLGLYIARRFVELHDGRIWVDDAPGGGAAFHVWLPRPAPAEPHADLADDATPFTARGPRG
jgi:signal transduction histidine kinase